MLTDEQIRDAFYADPNCDVLGGRAIDHLQTYAAGADFAELCIGVEIAAIVDAMHKALPAVAGTGAAELVAAISRLEALVSKSAAASTKEP